jgi:hypothetical protein
MRVLLIGKDNHLVYVEKLLSPGLQVRRVDHNLSTQRPVRPLSVVITQILASVAFKRTLR